jgi:uncharacterized RDD family membrane protein YckC
LLDPVPSGYAGLATRVLAFAADAVVINVVAWFVTAVVALGLSLLAIPHEVIVILAAIGAGIALLWSVCYFAFFWSASGQTPGNRLMRIRVQDAASGKPLRLRRAVLRVLVLPLSALPLCAGFLLVLVDDRRRALHDRLVRTVVVYVPEKPRAQASRRPMARPRATASERHDTSSLR